MLRRSLAVYSNPNDTYSASSNVNFGHQLSGQTFGAISTDLNYNNDPTSANAPYIEKVLFKPAVIFVLGILTCFILSMTICCRCCFAKCRPREIPDIDDGDIPESISKPLKYRRLFVNVIIIALCIFALVSDMVIYLGNTSLDAGVLGMKDILSYLTDKVKLMKFDADDLSSYGSSLKSSYSSAKTSCASSSLNSLQSSIDAYTSSVSSFSDALPSVKSALSLVLDNVSLYAIFYRTIFMYVVWALAIVSVLLSLLFKFCSLLCGMRLVMFWILFSFLIIIILGLVWMFTTSLLADYCVSPMTYLFNLLPSSGTITDIASYYSSCRGTNTLGNYMSLASNSTTYLSSTLTTISSNDCVGDSNIKSMKASLSSISTKLTSIDDLLTCSSINKKILTLVETNLCVDVYNGFFYIWLSQLVTSFLLFLLMCTVLYSFRFYHVQPYVGVDDGDYEQPATAEDVNIDDVGERTASKRLKSKEDDDDDDGVEIGRKHEPHFPPPRVETEQHNHHHNTHSNENVHSQEHNQHHQQPKPKKQQSTDDNDDDDDDDENNVRRSQHSKQHHSNSQHHNNNTDEGNEEETTERRKRRHNKH